MSIFFTIAIRNNLKLVARYIEQYRKKREKELIILTTLYNIDTKGNARHWTIMVDSNKYYSESGLVGSGYKTTQTKPKIAKEKNVGKTNYVSAKDQAYLEAKRKWDERYEKGHRTTIDEARSAVSSFFKPMLAEKYSDKLVEGNYPVMVQPKLDGIRCIMRKENGKIVSRSRNGKEFDTLEHLQESLVNLFDEYPNLILDGELYNHQYKHDFNKIISLVRKKRPDKVTDKWVESVNEARDKIQYWVYDVPQIESSDDMSTEYVKRVTEFLGGCVDDGLIPDMVKIVRSIWCDDAESIPFNRTQFMLQGFEGAMVRLNLPYESGRSKSLLKCKEFSDAEYLVVGIDEGEGNRSGTAKHLVCQDLETGKQFNSNIKGTFEWYKELLDNKDQYIGKLVTVQYANLTPDGIPRFPFAIAFRDYE